MSTRVLIIGCGIAGPVLAMLLKHKGFEPVIYERQSEIQQAGISLGVSPQTFKCSTLSALRRRSLPSGYPSKSSLPTPSSAERGIEMHFGKKLVDVKQEGNRVRALFQDGTQAEGDLLVGCDGLHSGVRNALFGKSEASYMGLVQVGGLAPIPDFFKSRKATAYQAFGDGAHFVCAPLGGEQMAWVTTMSQPTETREDWHRLNIDEARKVVKGLPVASWENGTKELVQSATFVTKYGLYDRPILDVWHKGRVVLVGDSAHPTSPHLGQGANQAMEDCNHLVRLLCKAAPFTDNSLEAAFTEYERIRIPIVTKSVVQAKKEGAKRILSGKEACEKRDEMIKGGGGVDPERAKLQMELVQGPFMGESEI